MHTSGGSDDKDSACSAGDPGAVPGWGRSPGAGNENPLQYSCLEGPMDRGTWQSAVRGVAEGREGLRNWTTATIQELEGGVLRSWSSGDGAALITLASLSWRRDLLGPGARPQRWKLGLVLMFAAGKGSVKLVLRALGKQQTEFRIQWLLREGIAADGRSRWSSPASVTQKLGPLFFLQARDLPLAFATARAQH